LIYHKQNKVIFYFSIGDREPSGLHADVIAFFLLIENIYFF